MQPNKIKLKAAQKTPNFNFDQLIDQKLSIEKALKKLGKEWEINNILDMVELGGLPIYVRACKWKGKEGGVLDFSNERIWSDESADNRENIQIIREAINNHQPGFKLILSDNQIAKKREGYERSKNLGHRKISDGTCKAKGESFLLSELFINADGAIVTPSEVASNPDMQLTSLLEALNAIENIGTLPEELSHNKIMTLIKDLDRKFPSRFSTWSSPTAAIVSTITEHTVYSDLINFNNVYFLKSDILKLKSLTSKEKKTKQLKTQVDDQQNKIKELKSEIDDLNKKYSGCRDAHKYKSEGLNALYSLIEEYYLDDKQKPTYFKSSSELPKEEDVLHHLKSNWPNGSKDMRVHKGIDRLIHGVNRENRKK